MPGIRCGSSTPSSVAMTRWHSLGATRIEAQNPGISAGRGGALGGRAGMWPRSARAAQASLDQSRLGHDRGRTRESDWNEVGLQEVRERSYRTNLRLELVRTFAALCDQHRVGATERKRIRHRDSQ